MFIKRRLYNDTYESYWKRVDVVNGDSQVIDWGSVSYGIDADPSSDISAFDLSSITLKMVNRTGFWNKETQYGSFFYPQDTYLTRTLSKIKITAAYIDREDYEISDTVIFEGFIESVVVSEDQTATIKAMSYLYILKQYAISDRAYTNTTKTVSYLVNDILSMSKISQFFTIDTITPAYNTSIAKPHELTGNYWDVLQRLALLSGSVIVCSWDTLSTSSTQKISFVPRTPATIPAWTLYGQGYVDADVYSTTNYDDEGAKRIVTRWEEENGVEYAETTNTDLKKKYKTRLFRVNLDVVLNSDKPLILNTLLSIWEQPKPGIVFRCRFLLNYVKVGDRVTYYAKGEINDSTPVWGQGVWGQGVWWKPTGSLIFSGGRDFYVTEVSHNLSDWTTTLRCEIIS
jgi:hypothetical protein